jgi:formate dehydrogenase subunit delta
MTSLQETCDGYVPVMALDRIVAMANQIGDFFAPYPPERRAEGIRNHLRT